MADAIRQIGVSEVTYYRVEQVKRLKDLELENTRLRKAAPDKLILQEAARGNF
jgi:hypothetical protein